MLPQIILRQRELSRAMDSAEWDGTMRNEMVDWLKSFQDDQTEMVLKLERLKLTVQLLTEENERLRNAGKPPSRLE